MDSKKEQQKDISILLLVFSIVCILGIISLLLSGIISGNFLKVSYVGTITMLFIVSICFGATQIKIASLHKKFLAYLNADGIILICTGVLSLITMGLFAIFSPESLKVEYFLSIFLSILILWKICLLFYQVKSKEKRVYLNILMLIGYILLNTSIVLYGNLGTLASLWFLIISLYLQLTLYAVYVILDYVKVENSYIDKSITMINTDDFNEEDAFKQIGYSYFLYKLGLLSYTQLMKATNELIKECSKKFDKETKETLIENL